MEKPELQLLITETVEKCEALKYRVPEIKQDISQFIFEQMEKYADVEIDFECEHIGLATYRIKVIGGWIVESENGCVFIPDKYHQWVVNKEEVELPGYMVQEASEVFKEDLAQNIADDLKDKLQEPHPEIQSQDKRFAQQKSEGIISSKLREYIGFNIACSFKSPSCIELEVFEGYIKNRRYLGSIIFDPFETESLYSYGDINFPIAPEIEESIKNKIKNLLQPEAQEKAGEDNPNWERIERLKKESLEFKHAYDKLEEYFHDKLEDIDRQIKEGKKGDELDLTIKVPESVASIISNHIEEEIIKEAKEPKPQPKKPRAKRKSRKRVK